LGFGGWGLGVGPKTPNPQSPIPNPQSPFQSFLFLIKIINRNIYKLEKTK